MKETSKKIMAMSKDKTEECESLMEQFQKAEKESIYYQNKCEEYLASAKDAKYLAGANEALTKEIHSLTKELEEMKSSNSEYYVKMKRLGRIEQEKLELEQQIAVQNEELNKLMAQKYELTHELTGLSKKLKGQEVEFAEKLEELVSQLETTMTICFDKLGRNSLFYLLYYCLLVYLQFHSYLITHF